MLYTKLLKEVSHYRRNESGTISIETAIILPVLLLALMTSYSIFHGYRQHSLSQKAGYTIGDMISRETNPLDQAYLMGAQRLLEFLTLSELQDTAIRVSSVKYDETNNSYTKNWSEAIGLNKAPLSARNVADLGGRLPIMKDKEHIMIVETWIDYDPPFDTGLARHDVVNFVFTRPRYAPQICWERC